MVSSKRTGMTLLEVLVALALSGLLFSSIVSVVTAFAVHETAVRAVGSNEAAEAAARAGVSRLILELRVGADTSDRFLGATHRAAFDSRCRSGGGWKGACRIELRVLRTADATRLEVRQAAQRWRAIVSVSGAAEMRYLRIAGGAREWVGDWGRSLGAPRAIALVTASDTLVLGARRP